MNRSCLWFQNKRSQKEESEKFLVLFVRYLKASPNSYEIARRGFIVPRVVNDVENSQKFKVKRLQTN